jgi:hypothetical protein
MSRAVGNRLPRAVAPVLPHCRQEADFKLKTPFDSHMLPNAIENKPRHAVLMVWIFACQPPRSSRGQKWREGGVQMRHIILFSIAAVVLAGVAAWVVTSIQSPKTPPVRSRSRRRQKICPLRSGLIGICGQITWINKPLNARSSKSNLRSA